MSNILYTLLSDGSSDQALIPILSWLLRRSGVEGAIQGQWRIFAAFLSLAEVSQSGFRWLLIYTPCQLLFVHRDAEAMPLQARKEEIEERR